ncbi:MAG: 2-oxoacid:acceptor oxidoreductase family protein [Deltaproteobacteria bacterium]|jgi:2-oxoglutarate ferredoxin oxidoreductase subunit gamma|nr:2-oxoacid:acceptor oxidoreductase family protein [Deltaproteobacteria bacterium]MBW2572610.1 2-oxoacid:acceptor oxidoreductase family protein [Deltaproteobacteria bacterium]MBW2669231.1 2-oxoacid:acceptor oxidoreductase family protein [Deltaproteobacteria bacterium]
MQSEVMFAGFGGQGILLIGNILAHAAMEQGSEVAWVPSYGPEMRGGTAYCLVAISDRPIGSPIIKNPMHLVAMNRPSLEKFAPMVKPKGVVVINSSLISIGAGRDDVDELLVPANDIAKDLGSTKVANIVALGAFVARSKIVDFEVMRKCVQEQFASKEKLIPINMAALDEGKKAARLK